MTSVWDLADISIDLDYEMSDVMIASVIVETPSGTLYVMASAAVSENWLFLDGLHMHGVLPNDIGLANLRQIARFVMKGFGYDGIVIQGGVRTSGANPGRTPGVLRFTRKV